VAGGVEDRIEALEPSVTIDEVQPGSSGRANVVQDKVDGRGAATNGGVERAGPGLTIFGELKGGLDGERSYGVD